MKSMLLALMLSAALGTAMVAQTEHNHPAASPGAGKSMSSAMPADCKNMMAKRDQMMADMKAMDASLDRKMAAMNSASGATKVDAMADVIKEMVAQRKQMQQKMMTMQQNMMQHMGSHMMAGKQSMMNCPMMNSTPQPKPDQQ